MRKFAVIFTALGVETRAVLRHLTNLTAETIKGTGSFRGQFEQWDIAVVEVGAGNSSAAALAVRMLEHYQPSVALFVGVAGGVKDVKIGDIVVGTKVHGYESGKDRAIDLSPRPDTLKTSHDLEQRGRMIRQQDSWKSRLDQTIEHGNPEIHVGPIAAGEKVVASTRSATAKLINKHYGDTLAIEMEGRGFLEGVHISHPVRGCVVRGISDLLSGKGHADRKGSQRSAADAASAVSFEILSGYHLDATSSLVGRDEEPERQRRTELPHLRPDAPLRWAHDHLLETETAESSAEVFRLLRDKARSGEIQVWGRPDSVGTSPENYYKPPKPIPAEHWDEFDFDWSRCRHLDDHRLCRSVPDRSDGLGHDKGFVDLRIVEAQIHQLFPTNLRAEFEEVPTNFGAIATRFFRLKVRNRTGRTHHGCRGKIIKIERLDASGVRIPTAYAETLPLTWATRQQPLPLVVDLLDGDQQALDVFFTLEGNKVGFAVQAIAHQPSSVTVFDVHGIFVITVYLQSEESKPLEIPIEFVWSGDWRTARARRLEQRTPRSGT